jgi:2-(3-amino-3-carboxypropyl)histidine synthase
MQGFDFEEERIKCEIKKHGAKRVLLQLPEGLKPQAPKLAKIVEAAGALPIVSADPCYGACDVADTEAEALGVDLIVHFGHARLVGHTRVTTVYVETRASVPVDEAVKKALPLLKGYRKIGLATSVQHLQTLDRAKKILEDAGKVVLVGDAGQLAYAGQVLGCNYSNVAAVAGEAEAFLFLGGGLFHALGIALATGKPTFIADPYDDRAYPIGEQAQKTLKQRFAIIQQAKKAAVFGVLVGLKPGQRHLETALAVKTQAQEKGKTAIVLAAREVTPEVLLEFPQIDAYVNTACPRVSLEAPGKFSKPVLTVNEFRVVLGEVSWESMLRGGLFES